MTMLLSNIFFKEDLSNLSDELTLYFKNKFSSSDKLPSSFIDDPSVKSWKGYCKESIEHGAFQVLKKCYPQLNFPVTEGINKSQPYIDAVLKGRVGYIAIENNLEFNNSEGIEISIFDSIAGKIPVVKIPDSQDFIQIIQCLLHKNNPTSVPLSMGACLVNGINNWDRLHTLQHNWVADNPTGNWNEEFSKNVLSNPTLFKDKIIILSTKSYSNVSNNILGLSDRKSVV